MWNPDFVPGQWRRGNRQAVYGTRNRIGMRACLRRTPPSKCDARWRRSADIVVTTPRRWICTNGLFLTYPSSLSGLNPQNYVVMLMRLAGLLIVCGDSLLKSGTDVFVTFPRVTNAPWLTPSCRRAYIVSCRYTRQINLMYKGWVLDRITRLDYWRTEDFFPLQLHALSR